MADTKIKIVKTKLLALYDGNLEQAKSLAIEDIIDNIANRVTYNNTLSPGLSRRVASS